VFGRAGNNLEEKKGAEKVLDILQQAGVLLLFDGKVIICI
jgi:hypothetical protein